MKDYSDIGLTKRLRKQDSIASKPSEFESVLAVSIKEESSPYLNRTAISKGTIETRSGGLPQFRSTIGTSGGTIVMEVDPDTGTVTIRGGLVADSSLNLGTINNTKLAGTPELIGTLTNSRLINNGTWNNGTLGTPAITGGTINNIVFGTQDSTGGTIRTAVINNSTIGTQNATGGTLASVTVNNAIIGTPAITGGTHNSATFGTPTIIRPTIDGTPNFDINAGSAALGVNGDFAIQTHTGSAILVARVGGTTFYFTSAGTLA